MYLLYKIHFYNKIALFKVAIILWEIQANSFKVDEGDIMSIIGGIIFDYNKFHKVSVLSRSSKIIIHTDWNETTDFQSWYNTFEK